MPKPVRYIGTPTGTQLPALPSAAEATMVAPAFSASEFVDNLTAGLGMALGDRVEGLGQMVTHPVNTAREFANTLMTVARNPRSAGNALLDAAVSGVKRASSGPLGFGEVAGQFLPMPKAPQFRGFEISNKLPDTSRMGHEKLLFVYNLDTPEFSAIANDVAKTLPPFSWGHERAWLHAIENHPNYDNAEMMRLSRQMKAAGRNAAASLNEELTKAGAQVRWQKSNALGSISTYLTATKNGKSVKIRLSDHQNGITQDLDINTTPQHWKSAFRKAMKKLDQK